MSRCWPSSVCECRHLRFPQPGTGLEPEPFGRTKADYLEVEEDSQPPYQAAVRFHAAWPVETIEPTETDTEVLAYGRNTLPVVESEAELPVILMHSVGRGRVVLIGDTAFAMNKNLEYIGGEPFYGGHENAHFWRWLLTQLRGRAAVGPATATRACAGRPGSGRSGIGGGGIVVRIWLATALLACSWLFGLGYFDPVSWVAWVCALAAAVLLLGVTSVRFPRRVDRGLALLLLVPAVWMTPLPYKSMPVLLFAGLALSLLPVSARGHENSGTRIGLGEHDSAPSIPGVVVVSKPDGPFARVAALAGQAAGPGAALLGAEAAVDRATLVVRDTATTDRIAATWELLLDPATVCLVVGGVARCWPMGRIARVRFPGPVRLLVRSCAVLLLVTLAWVPLRLALLVSLVVQQQLRADAALFPNVGEILGQYVGPCRFGVCAGRDPQPVRAAPPSPWGR